MIDWSLSSPSSYSLDHDQLGLWLTGATLLTLFIVTGLVVFFSWRYHHSKDVDRRGARDNNTKLEWTWTAGIAAVFIFFFVWSARMFLREAQSPIEADYTVYAFAKQWAWKFQHASGKTEVNQLTVPMGKRTKIVMISHDVIHSLYLPDFREKQDVLPEFYTSISILPTKTGTFRLNCAEYCGANHSKMGGIARVIKEADYKRRFLQTKFAKTSGQELFRKHGCAECHSKGNGAPGLQGRFGRFTNTNQGVVRFDENYIRESLFYPSQKVAIGHTARMPSFLGSVPEEEISKLIEYLKKKDNND